MENTNKNKEKELNNNLNNFLDKNTSCEGDECLIKDNDELVQREHKKIITNDGRQLLSEYTR
mgnify:FL=1|tara:strand:- start:259 stop:444 length:186 start_codon:yes stop_codon:yes gene_type:complete